MRRNTAWRYRVLITLAAAAGCIDTSANQCPLDPDQASNVYQLDYEVTAPYECPVPIAVKGERKQAAGIVWDRGNRDFASDLLQMFNSRNQQLQSGADLFQLVGGVYQAQPEVFYSGATGVSSVQNGQLLPNPLPPEASDHGRFYALFRSSDSPSSSPASGLLKVLYEWGDVRLAVSGSEIPLRNTSRTWTASASNGTSPYRYEWYRDGQLVSQAGSYSTTVGTTDFGLRVEVWDATQAYGRKDMWIDVDGIRGTITGPNIVYLSEGGGTWTASATGGSTPYSYKWYVRDGATGNIRYLGSGSSWHGYPGEGNNFLHLNVTNGTEHQHDAERIVNGIGDPNGGCVPEPPAVTC
jgi:hypothetical protein